MLLWSPHLIRFSPWLEMIDMLGKQQQQRSAQLQQCLKIIIILPRTTDGHAIETSSISPAPEEADVWSSRTRIIIRFVEGETRIDPTTVHLPHSTLQQCLRELLWKLVSHTVWLLWLAAN
jgi:hypothetical protein